MLPPEPKRVRIIYRLIHGEIMVGDDFDKDFVDNIVLYQPTKDPQVLSIWYFKKIVEAKR